VTSEERTKFHMTRTQGRFYVGEGGHVPPNSLVTPVSPQIQKLAGRSDVISDVSKCSKIKIFRGFDPDPANPLADGEGLTAPSQEPHPVSSLGPSGLICTGLRDLPITEFSILLMIDLKCRPI